MIYEELPDPFASAPPVEHFRPWDDLLRTDRTNDTVEIPRLIMGDLMQ